MVQNVAKDADLRTIAALRQVCKAHYELLNRNWASTNLPPITLTQAQMNALMQAAPEEADDILGIYNYKNADAGIRYLTKIFFQDPHYGTRCPHLPALLLKLEHRGGHLAREDNMAEPWDFHDRLRLHPKQWQAFVHLALRGFIGDPYTGRYSKILLGGFIHLLSLEDLKKCLCIPEFLAWAKKVPFIVNFNCRRIGSEEIAVLADAIGFMCRYQNGQYFIEALMEGCDAEYALRYVEAFLAHPDRQQYPWGTFGPTILEHLACVRDFPLEAFRLLVEANVGMWTERAFKSGLNYCADPLRFIEFALEQGATDYLRNWEEFKSAFYHLIENKNCRIEDCTFFFRAWARPKALSYRDWPSNEGGIWVRGKFEAKFATSLEETLRVAEQTETATTETALPPEQAGSGL